ncbi:hypothetical protein WAI453_000767 [Rhynchosporium graminicola]
MIQFQVEGNQLTEELMTTDRRWTNQQFSIFEPGKSCDIYEKQARDLARDTEEIKRLVAELGSGEYDLMREWILSASGVHRNLWHSWPEFIKRETDVIVEQKIPDVEMMSMQEGKQEGLDSVGCWTSGKKGLGQATYLQGSMKESMNSVHASEDSAILPDLGDQTVDSSRYQDSLGARDGEMPPSDAAAFARMCVSEYRSGREVGCQEDFEFEDDYEYER